MKVTIEIETDDRGHVVRTTEGNSTRWRWVEGLDGEGVRTAVDEELARIYARSLIGVAR